MFPFLMRYLKLPYKSYRTEIRQSLGDDYVDEGTSLTPWAVVHRVLHSPSQHITPAVATAGLGVDVIMTLTAGLHRTLLRAKLRQRYMVRRWRRCHHTPAGSRSPLREHKVDQRLRHSPARYRNFLRVSSTCRLQDISTCLQSSSLLSRVSNLLLRPRKLSDRINSQCLRVNSRFL